MVTNFERQNNLWVGVVANTGVAVQGKMVAIANNIATHASWTVATSWLDAGGNNAVVVLDDGTNEICFASSTTTDLNVANVFGGAVYGNDEFMVAICPNGSFGVIGAGNNPFDTATFCSAAAGGAGSFRFMPVRLNAGGTVFYNDSSTIVPLVAAGSVLLVTFGTSTSTYSKANGILLLTTSGFEAQTVAGDTDTSLAAHLPLTITNQHNITNFTVGSFYSNLKVAFRVAGTAGDDGDYEDGDFTGTSVLNLDAANHQSSGLFASGTEKLRKITCASATIGGGEKGTINSEMLAICRADAGGICIGGTHQHIWDGLCVGLDLAGRQIG